MLGGHFLAMSIYTDSIFESHALIDMYCCIQRLTIRPALYKIGTVARKNACKLFIQEVWLPGMGSNHE